MAHLTQTATTPTRAATDIRGLFAERLDALRLGFARWRTYRTTLEQLQALTDRDLADLGVYRGNIPQIAREAAYGAN